MKTAEALKTALNKYREERARLQTDLDDIERVWKKSGETLFNPDFLVACVKEREHIENELKQSDFKIRFVEWILSEPKEETNETKF